MLAVLWRIAKGHCSNDKEAKRDENVHPAASRGLQLSPGRVTGPPAYPRKATRDQSVARDRLHGAQVQDYEYAS
jgi:hypothetical protein